MVSSPETWCAGASSNRDPSSIPGGKGSHTGYQNDSISRVAGQREPAPPSKFSKEGGFRNSVFKGIFVWSLYLSIESGRGRLVVPPGSMAEEASQIRPIPFFSAI